MLIGNDAIISKMSYIRFSNERAQNHEKKIKSWCRWTF